MQRFTDLKVWQRSQALTLQIYRASAAFPAHERFGPTSTVAARGSLGAGEHRRGEQMPRRSEVQPRY